MILLLAGQGDEHVLAVSQALARLGRSDLFRLDASAAMSEIALEVRSNSGSLQWNMVHATDGRKLHPDNLSAVYARRFGIAENVRRLRHADSTRLDEAEVYGACRSLISALPPHLFPLDHPDASHRAANKLLQLSAAQAVGMRTPATLYSNDARALATFAREHPMVAVKPLTQPGVNLMSQPDTQQLLWCRAVEGKALAAQIERRTQTQLYLQEAIPKVRDLRIMVLPRAVFACEIDTSSLPATEPDWRNALDPLPHQRIELEPAFEQQLRRYLAAMGITTGSFDFGVTANGERVFFECNPSGQWLWLERLTGAPIAEAVARALIAGRE